MSAYAQTTTIEMSILHHPEAMNDGSPGWVLTVKGPDAHFVRKSRRPGPLLDAAELWAAQRGMAVGFIHTHLMIPGDPNATVSAGGE